MHYVAYARSTNLPVPNLTLSLQCEMRENFRKAAAKVVVENGTSSGVSGAKISLKIGHIARGGALGTSVQIEPFIERSKSVGLAIAYEYL